MLLRFLLRNHRVYPCALTNPSTLTYIVNTDLCTHQGVGASIAATMAGASAAGGAAGGALLPMIAQALFLRLQQKITNTSTNIRTRKATNSCLCVPPIVTTTREQGKFSSALLIEPLLMS